MKKERITLYKPVVILGPVNHLSINVDIFCKLYNKGIWFTCN